MSFISRLVAHCDVPTCGHEWLTNGIPTHCAKCKSRKWNVGSPKDPENPGTFKDGTPDVGVAGLARLMTKMSEHDPKICNVYKCGMCAVSQ